MKEDLRVSSLRVPCVSFLACLVSSISLLQFERRVPFSEWVCSFFSYVHLFVFVYGSDGRKEASPPFEGVDGHRRNGFLDFRGVHVGRES